MKNTDSSFEHFVYFTYKLEWEISKEFEPQGYLTISLPQSFPTNTQIFRIPIDKRNGFIEKTIDACVDDFFIDCAIRKSFLHIVRYSKKNLKNVQEKIKNKSTDKNNNHSNKNTKCMNNVYHEKFTPESIFLDAGVLFVPNRRNASITVDMDIFDYLTFSIQIDEELLSIPHIKKFAPTILHITKIDNLFNDQTNFHKFNELNIDPIYFECQVGSNSYFLVPRYDKNQKTILIDAAILISPRKDNSIVFRIFDKCERIPESPFIGSGLYVPTIWSEEEEEENNEEEVNADNQKLVKSISEENLSTNENRKNEKALKAHHRHHHSKSKSNQKDESFIQTMKKVEEMTNPRPSIQFTSPLKQIPPESGTKQVISTPEKTQISRKRSKYEKSNSGRKSRIMTDNQLYDVFTPVSKPLTKKNSSTKTTEVIPTNQQNFDKKPEFGYCQFYLFPERHSNMKMISSTNSDNYKNITISFDVYDPASKFPPQADTKEIKRPSILHKRPPITSTPNRKDIIYDNYLNDTSTYSKSTNNKAKINILLTHNNELFTNDNNLSKLFPEDPKILAIEKPTIKLLRWIVSCPRFSPISLKLINFIQSFHKTTIHGYSHILNPCFKNCVRKSPDLITGFHFVSPKEEVFVLETRAYRPNKASLSLELFLRNEIPIETHIIGNNSIAFPAPRLYCCTESLIQRVEIPISLNELLQVNGLYFHKNDNHKLFPIAQKLTNLLQSKKTTEIIDSFPNYSEIKVLEKRAPGLYAMPLQKSLSITPILPAKGTDFGDLCNDNENNNDSNTEGCNLIINNKVNNNLNIINNYFVSINDPQQSKNIQIQTREKNKERLTTYYLAKPGTSSKNQRSESVSLKSKKKDLYEENSNNSIYVKPPDHEQISSKKAPRNISTKQPS